MITRRLYGQEHERYRTTVREFLQREVVPHQLRWLEAGVVDREVWRKAGAAGLLCAWLPKAQGGPGGDFLHACIINEELASIYETGLGIRLHSDAIVPLLWARADDEQKARWLAGCASGDLITAIAMTEPAGGSDLAALATTARRDGDDYVLHGTKTYISNGLLFDLCVVAARTGTGTDPLGSLSLFVVEASSPGLRRRALSKLGMRSQDTAELTLDGCRVSAKNRLGSEGGGFAMLMKNLTQERLVEAVNVQATVEQVLADTVRHVKAREAFGGPLARQQGVQQRLAGCAAQVAAGRALIDRTVSDHLVGSASAADAALAKLWCTNALSEVAERCVQLFGAAGYLSDHPVGRAWLDARARHLAAGTDEILQMIIARDLRLG